MTESITIMAPPEDVWPWVIDLVKMREWNSKLAEAEPRTSGNPRVGFTCRTVWRMGSRTKQFLTRIEACDPPRRVTFAHQDEAQPRRVIRQHFDLLPRAGGKETLVRQQLDFAQSGVPLPVRWLMAVISRFGKPADGALLDDLRKRVEL
jgi:uncharacterized protein YndB with AHSA1/START domain